MPASPGAATHKSFAELAGAQRLERYHQLVNSTLKLHRLLASLPRRWRSRALSFGGSNHSTRGSTGPNQTLPLTVCCARASLRLQGVPGTLLLSPYSGMGGAGTRFHQHLLRKVVAVHGAWFSLRQLNYRVSGRGCCQHDLVQQIFWDKKKSACQSRPWSVAGFSTGHLPRGFTPAEVPGSGRRIANGGSEQLRRFSDLGALGVAAFILRGASIQEGCQREEGYAYFGTVVRPGPQGRGKRRQLCLQSCRGPLNGSGWCRHRYQWLLVNDQELGFECRNHPNRGNRPRKGRLFPGDHAPLHSTVRDATAVPLHRQVFVLPNFRRWLSALRLLAGTRQTWSRYHGHDH